MLDLIVSANKKGPDEDERGMSSVFVKVEEGGGEAPFILRYVSVLSGEKSVLVGRGGGHVILTGHREEQADYEQSPMWGMAAITSHR